MALTASIQRKRPDAINVHWSWRLVWILEFSRVNDSREDWCETVEKYKSSRYQPLRDIMTEALPRNWSVEQINLTIGIRGSFAETQWTAALASRRLERPIPHLAVPDGTVRTVLHTSRCTATESGCTTVTIEQILGRVADRSGLLGRLRHQHSKLAMTMAIAFRAQVSAKRASTHPRAHPPLPPPFCTTGLGVVSGPALEWGNF